MRTIAELVLSPCLLALLLLGWNRARNPDPETLLSEGHAAFARGDCAGASVLYEQAEICSTDPARVDFYLAGAKYHLALKAEGPSPELREAEQLYRCCLDPADPNRPRALCGLGNCLLRKAGTRDLAGLRAALACYDRSMHGAGDDAELLADARYNREKVRLMLLQVQPPPNVPPGEKPPPDDIGSPPRHDPRQLGPEAIGEKGSEGSDSQAGAGAVEPRKGTEAAKTDAPPSPGKGNLPPIPDEVDVPPLSAHDATEHLELAANKVRQERRMHHRRGERGSAAGVKDW